jgi:transposase
MVKNRIHALLGRQPGVAAGLKTTDLFTAAGQRLLKALKLPATDRKLLDEDLALLEEIHQHILCSDRLVRELAKKDRRARHLATIPGIGTFFAVLIAHEIDDVSRFRSDRKLHSYMGLVPSTHASGDKVFHGRITRQGNKWLRWAFVEAVWPAVEKDPHVRQLYERIKQTKGANAAKVVAARRLATIAYRLLKQNRDYEVRDAS